MLLRSCYNHLHMRATFLRVKAHRKSNSLDVSIKNLDIQQLFPIPMQQLLPKAHSTTAGGHATHLTLNSKQK